VADAAALLAEARRALAPLPDLVEALVADLDPARWHARPAPAEWAPIEIVCHLRDEETEDFPTRLRVVVEGGTAFAPIDPQGWVEVRRYRETDLAAALAALRAGRAASLAWLATVEPERLRGSVAHPRLGALSGLDVLAAWVAHDRLHLAQLAATLARLWADRWAPLRVDYAGPIPYSPVSPD
jgi:DinB superfamily